MSHIEPCLLTGVGARDACASKILREGCPAVPTKLDVLCGKIRVFFTMFPNSPCGEKVNFFTDR